MNRASTLSGEVLWTRDRSQLLGTLTARLTVFNVLVSCRLFRSKVLVVPPLLCLQGFVCDEGLSYKREIGVRMERLHSLRAYRSQTHIMRLYLVISDCRLLEDTRLGYRTRSASISGVHSTDTS